MGNAVDFDKIRKRRQRMVTLKRLMILTGVMILTGAAIFIYDIILEESAVTSLSDYFESRGGSGFPADLPGGIIRGVTNIGGSLAVLNDTNLYIYNKKAKIVQNIQRMSDQTIAVTSDSRVLTFSVGSKSFSVHSISRERFSQTLELGILCGDMNNAGDFAVVAPVKEFASKVYVYDRYFKQIYSWSSPEYVTAVSLSPKGDMMAVNCVSGGRDGVLESLIYIFKFAEQREKAEISLTLGDSLCLGLDFTGDDRIELLTDKQFMILDQSGAVKQIYDFNGRRLLSRESFGQKTLLHFEGQGKNENELVLLDESLGEISKLTLNERITDLALGKDVIHISTAVGIKSFNHEMEQASEHEIRGVTAIHLVDTRLYYLTYNQICVLG